MGLNSIIKNLEKQFKLKARDVQYKEVEFPDASLGLPKKGECYIEMVIEGYKILVDTNKGKRLFHASEDGELIRENKDLKSY